MAAETAGLFTDIRRQLGEVRCEYPRDPCVTAKGIANKCHTCIAVAGALRSLSTLEAVVALLDKEKTDADS